MAAKANNSQINSVKGPVIITPVGKALFVSAPNASAYDENKQEATILLDADGVTYMKGKLQEFMDSPEAKASGIKDTGFVENMFKEDTDQDGNATGLMKLKAKTAMRYPAKFRDAKGNIFTPDASFSLPNRSTIRLSAKVELLKTSMFQGLVLRLQAIKVLEMPQMDDGFGDDGMDDEYADSGFSFDTPSAQSAPADTSSDDNDGWE